MFLFSTYPSPSYAIAFSISFWSWVLFEVWVLSRERGKEKSDTRGTGLWVMLSLAIGITLGLNMPVMAPAFNIQNHFGVYFVLGILLTWIGVLFRFWSIQTLGRLFSTRLVIQDGHELVTRGPYRYLRHPSYTAAMVTMVGFGFGVGNWLTIAVLLLTVMIAYARRIRAEESILQGEFGRAYEDYKKRTWALIPFIW